MKKRDIRLIISLIIAILALFPVSQKIKIAQNVPAQSTPTPTPFLASPSASLYTVSYVVDGDTIDVAADGKKERVRLIGVDTPEKVDPRKPVQCYAAEASEKMKELVLGKSVRLQKDPTQANEDKYQRLLRYVYMEDGTDVGKQLLLGGYAHEYTYQSKPYIKMDEYKAAEQQAASTRVGLWQEGLCN